MHAEILLEAGRQRTSRKSCENLTEDHSPGRFVGTAGPAALRDLDPAHDRFGSFASLRRAARLRRMSAMLSMATESVRRNEPTRCAGSGCERKFGSATT